MVLLFREGGGICFLVRGIGPDSCDVYIVHLYSRRKT